MTAIRFRPGRRAPHPEETHPRLRLRPFLRMSELPPIPDEIDYISRVGDWPMYANDEIGDCGLAAPGHMVEGWTTYGQDSTVVIPEADIIAAYEAVGGYVPGRPETDQGVILQDVLSYWRKVGIGGHRIVAFAELDVHDLDQIRAALYLFGHVLVGASIPQSAIDQFNDGRPWDVTRRSPILGGHAFNVGWYRGRFKAVTWGAVQELTLRWWLTYVEEAWVGISADWLSAAGISPPGLDMPGIGSVFTELTGEPFPLIPPDPGPTPAPPAADPADVELAAAMRSWLDAKGL